MVMMASMADASTLDNRSPLRARASSVRWRSSSARARAAKMVKTERSPGAMGMGFTSIKARCPSTPPVIGKRHGDIPLRRHLDQRLVFREQGLHAVLIKTHLARRHRLAGGAVEVVFDIIYKTTPPQKASVRTRFFTPANSATRRI